MNSNQIEKDVSYLCTLGIRRPWKNWNLLGLDGRVFGQRGRPEKETDMVTEQRKTGAKRTETNDKARVKKKD